MPLYAFQCSAGHQYDQIRFVDHRNQLSMCPKCGGLGNRLIVAPAVHGFTEYADENLSGEGDAKPYVVKSRADRERRRKELGLCDPGPSLRARDIQKEARRQAHSVSLTRR